MVNSGTEKLKRAQLYTTVCIMAGIVAFSLTIAKTLYHEHWLRKRDAVACIPSDVNNVHPLVYHQTGLHPVNDDAVLKRFIERYIHLTQDESIVDYHATTNNARYKDARLSAAKMEAYEMSTGIERALNMKRYADSSDLYYELKNKNLGWVFLVDDILVNGVPGAGAYFAVIRGEFQVMYDTVKADLPSRLWGYREIRLYIVQGAPDEDNKGNLVNKYGFYVAQSSVEVLSSDKKEALTKRNSQYYLMD